MERFISVLVDYEYGRYAVVDTVAKRVLARCERNHDALMIAEALSASPVAVEQAEERAKEVPF